MRKKIALIEDAQDSAEVFTLFLNDLCDEFEVSSFPDGQAFLDTFQPAMYRLIILDISLPGIDGYEVLHRLREIDSTVPVIAFTAHAGANFHAQAIRAGFFDVVIKPVQDMAAFCQQVIKVADAGNPAA